MANRLFYILDLDCSVLYEDVSFEDLETVRSNDYTVYQLRSFSFCRAQKVANDRLYRLDELKAVIDQIFTKEGFDRYADLREDIADSHAIEYPEDVARELSKEDKKKHNQQASQGIKSMLRS